MLPEHNLPWPADLYLEGSDQHRGWFQTSLIPSVALTGAGLHYMQPSYTDDEMSDLMDRGLFRYAGTYMNLFCAADESQKDKD